MRTESGNDGGRQARLDSTYFTLISPIHQRFIDIENRVRRWRPFKRSKTIYRSIRKPTHITSISTPNSARSMSADPDNSNYMAGMEESQSTSTTPSSGFSSTGTRRPRERPSLSRGDDHLFTMPMPRKIARRDNTISSSPQTSRELSLWPLLSRNDVVNVNWDPVGPDYLTDREVEERFNTIRQNQGILCIGGHKFSNVLKSDLIKVCELGEGTCGQVSKFKFKNRALAVKELKRTDKQEESKRIFMDLEVCRKCNDCDYIVKCFGYIIEDETINICMELMTTCLEKLMQKSGDKGAPENALQQITLCVVNALNYLKETHKIMHRDIKPSNILTDYYGNVKLCDFGISGKLIDSKASTMSTGCAAYLAPERICTGCSEYDVRADVWSLGVTLLQLALGRFPYRGKNPFEIMIAVKEEPAPKLQSTDGFTEEFCDFVNSCLQKDVKERPKYRELLIKPFLANYEYNPAPVEQWYNKVMEEYQNSH